MVSALTVLFLGCWLAGQSGARGPGPLPKPSISANPRGVIPVGTHVTIRCWTEQRGVRFLLYKDGAENYRNYRDSAGSDAEFRIFISSREHGGNYTCRYSNKAGALPYSVSSDPVQIMVEEGTDLAGALQQDPPTTAPQGEDAGSTPTSGTSTTQRETPSAPSPSATDAGSTPTRGPISDGSGSDLSGAIVAGVIVGAAGLLLLLLGFLCHRRTRAREGPASRQSRESEAATTVYALAGLGKQQDVPKPDPGAEGLTYTELDRQALQAKQEAPKQDAQVPAPEPVLYATVSRSQGAPQPPP